MSVVVSSPTCKSDPSLTVNDEDCSKIGYKKYEWVDEINGNEFKKFHYIRIS